MFGQAVAAAVFALQGPLIPTPIGVGTAFHPPPGAHRCAVASGYDTRVHLELFARGRVVVIPSGICSPTVRTTDPTGVIAVRRGGSSQVTLGEFFDAWQQRLAPSRLATFTGRVRAYLSGTRWRGDIRAIPLTRHAQIVVEVGPVIPPHRFFLFGARG